MLTNTPLAIVYVIQWYVMQRCCGLPINPCRGGHDSHVGSKLWILCNQCTASKHGHIKSWQIKQIMANYADGIGSSSWLELKIMGWFHLAGPRQMRQSHVSLFGC